MPNRTAIQAAASPAVSDQPKSRHCAPAHAQLRRKTHRNAASMKPIRQRSEADTSGIVVRHFCDWLIGCSGGGRLGASPISKGLSRGGC